MMQPTPADSLARVLVVEDEPHLQEALVSYLNMEGMQAHGLGTLTEAQAWMATHDFDVLLLDLGLPDGDGLSWLKRRMDLRNKGVIITTARSDGLSRVTGVRAGADVYLVKPVLPEEIASLVQNLMRRLHGPATTPWVLHSTRWQLQGPPDQTMKLTHSEHLLLLRLARSSGQAVSREDLAISLGQEAEHYDYRRLEVMVRRLRGKAKELWGDAFPLETAHRQGYAFTESIRITAQ